MASPKPRSSNSKQVSSSFGIEPWFPIKEIGSGSFATVYLGKHAKRSGFVAIKSVRLSKLNSKKLRDNLHGEIKIIEELKHPHIVSFFDCKETPSHIHLILEFCSAGDLSHFIKARRSLASDGGPLKMFKKYPNPELGGFNDVVVRHFVKQFASALRFLRERNLIHRDLKPQNLLLNPSYRAELHPDAVPYMPEGQPMVPLVGVDSLPVLKIADFGFARQLEKSSLAETLCGSPLYMGPEILRYEKYDAKADLWSVGAVTYELVAGRPPFRAENHLNLLKAIEEGNDYIRFSPEIRVSRDVKSLIRGLLKRSPVERMSFEDFFGHPVITEDITGLVEGDSQRSEAPPPMSRSDPLAAKAEAKTDVLGKGSSSKQGFASSATAKTAGEDHFVDALDYRPTDSPRRPSIKQADTAPVGHTHHTQGKLENAGTSQPPPAVAASRPKRTEVNPRRASVANGDHTTIKAAREAREERERAAAQDVALEREWVHVEKKAVEMNALADEFQANPRIHGVRYSSSQPQSSTMMRRNTTQVTTMQGGTQAATSRAIQLAAGKRPDQLRQASSDRRLKGGISASSAISKALSMASGRLWSLGISPPLGLGRGGPSPPLYSPFPTYPAPQVNQLLIEDRQPVSAPLDADGKALYEIEELATEADVVYGFAEVKYIQIVPQAPSNEHGLGIRGPGVDERTNQMAGGEDAGELTADALVTICEEALVLYVKALDLLARSMDVAGSWWARKSSNGTVEDAAPARPLMYNPVVATRINSVVQWVRTRFNATLEKAEFVRLKLSDTHKRLPSDHPSHPNNQPAASTSATGLGATTEVYVTPGVSAEKIMYQRALEMSKSAAVNEIMNEDLAGCEISYVTAIRMLEVVLQSGNQDVSQAAFVTEREAPRTGAEEDEFNPMNPEDRESVAKLIEGTRMRLAALQRKKAQMHARRKSVTTLPSHSRSPKARPLQMAVAGSAPAR